MRRRLFKSILAGALAVAIAAGLVSSFVGTRSESHRDAKTRAAISEPSALEKSSDRGTSDRRIAAKVDHAKHPRSAVDTTEDIEVPAGPYSEVIPDLRIAAHAGDARAAYVLSRVLIDCFLVGRGQPSGFGSGIPDRCNRVAVVDTSEALEMMQKAADAGLVQAQVLYPDAASELMTPTDMIRDPDAVKQYKERSMAYLASAANQGSVDALLQIANAYANGIMTERNLQMAYAYRYATNLAFPDLGNDDPARLYGGGLTDEQLSVAKSMGNKIYRQCCG